MAKNNYLEILGLEPGADEASIKNAFRKLSKIYHPDLNKKVDAKEKFIEIHEAYKFLITAGPNPVGTNNVSSYDYDPYDDAYESWRRQAKAFAHQKARQAAKERNLLIEKSIYYFNYFTIISSLFSCLLVADFLLPNKPHAETITSIIVPEYISSSDLENQQGDTYPYEIAILTSNYELRIIGNLDPSLQYYDKAIVYASPIFNKAAGITITIDGVSTSYDQSLNVYYVFGFFILGSILLVILYWLNRGNYELQLNFAVIIAMLFLVQLIFAIIA